MTQEPAPQPRKPIREVRGAVATLLDCRDREILIEGPGGTGKTTGILAAIHRDAWLYPNSRQLICRQTRVSMTESVLKTWEQAILGDNHPAYSGTASRANRHSYDFPNDSTVVVGGLDNPTRLFSTEWDRVYVAEAIEISLDDWESLGRAMRNYKMPFHQRVADTNPGAPGHWLNKRADAIPEQLRTVASRADYDRLQEFNNKKLERRMRRLVSKHQDNPAYWNWPAWGWTKRGDEYVNGELASMSAHRRARLLEGRWVSAEGGVFPEFSETRHVVQPFNVPAHWPQFVGVDPGFDHPCAILWFTVSPNDTIYIIDELYRGGLSVAEHARDIHARNIGRTIRRYFGDPQHAFSQTAQATVTIAQQFAKCGISLAPWPRTGVSAEAMVDRVRRRLQGDQLKVFSTCDNTISEFQTWRYKRTAKGELPTGDDQFEDANNHAMDVVKGVVTAGISFDQKGIIAKQAK